MPVGRKNRKNAYGRARKKLGQGRGASRATATRVLAQGAAAVPRRAFGSAKQSIPRGLPCAAWNAMSSNHAGLPRAVGPYSVVRTTTMFTSRSPLLIFGTYTTNFTQSQSSTDYMGALMPGFLSGPKQWSNVCCMSASEDIDVGDFHNAAIGGGNHTQMHQIPLPGAAGNELKPSVNTGVTPNVWKFQFENANTTAVPSAMSVQVICPKSVQEAEGACVAAVCPVRMDLCNSEKSWGTIGSELLSYFRPRVMTGGKLALRGVQMDSLPLSMTDVSDFREMYYTDPLVCYPSNLHWCDGYRAQGVPNVPGKPDFTETEKNFPVPIHPEGWAPMVYYSPFNADKAPSERVDMTFLVTTEWRVRFDISNPAVASHTSHPLTSDVQWHNHVKAATAALPGVIDIVEKVANAGIGIYKGMALAGLA